MSAVPRRDVLHQIEHGLYAAASYLLAVAAVSLLGTAVVETVQHWSSGVDAAIIHLLDRVLLALMLAEITYTLRQAERTHALTATPFLIIGIIAAVRRMLIVTAESVGHADLADPRFVAGMIEIGVLGATVLVFTLAIHWPGRWTGE